MESRLEMLKRLASLYTSVEEMHSIELRTMTTAVREVEQAISAERQVVLSARTDGRGALQQEDRLGWMIAETRQEAASMRRKNLERLRLRREELHDAARKQFAASRLKREQMKRVFDDMVTRREIEESRRMQAASDDRFAARRRWTDVQEKLHKERQMNEF